nr:SGNH/GDSL hydrolase family protein [Myxococcota bacterium]
RLGRTGLVVASTLFALIAVELALRAIGRPPERFARTASIESADKRAAIDLYPDDPRGYFPLDLREESAREAQRARGLEGAMDHWQRAPFGVSFDYTPELCRGVAIPPRGEAGARVVVIGDSFTEGQGVREEDTFVAALDRRIEGAQLINCGRRGYDFPALSAWFERHLALEPDVVVYAMLLNDPEQSESFHARQAYLDDWILDRRRMVDGDGAPPRWQPWLWALLHDRLEGMRVGAATTRWYQEMVEAPNAEGWAATLDRIEAMRDAMRARGGAFVVVLWPLMIDLDGAYPFTETHGTIVRALESRDITVHDALPAFVGRDEESLWVHPADRHPNELAHAIFADAIEGTVRAAVDLTGSR